MCAGGGGNESESSATSSSKSSDILLPFTEIQIIEVNRNNFSKIWPYLLVCIKPADFTAMDLELSGLGGPGLRSKDVQERNKSIREAAGGGGNESESSATSSSKASDTVPPFTEIQIIEVNQNNFSKIWPYELTGLGGPGLRSKDIQGRYKSIFVSESSATSSSKSLETMSPFTEIQIIEVNRNNFSKIWPYLLVCIKSADFTTMDLELNGLGGPGLRSKDVQGRYKSIREAAHTRSILSVGTTTMKLIRKSEKRRSLRYETRIFNILTLSEKPFTIEPSALQFLAKHSFDFNRFIQSGVQFHGNNCPLKTLFHEFLGSSATLCLHNGFVDLAFLYKQMYDVDLPETLDEFVNNLSDLFPDDYLPIADSKYLAEYQTRYKSSYLEYVFRRTQGDNEIERQAGRYHIENDFSTNENVSKSLKEATEIVDVRLPEGFPDHAIPIDLHIHVCKYFAYHGFCHARNTPKGCKMLHEVDAAIDLQRIKENKKAFKIIEVKRDNFSKIWPYLLVCIKSADFTAMDLELSGLGGPGLRSKDVQGRYKSIQEDANTRSILSVGITTMKLIRKSEKRRSLRYETRIFNILTLSEKPLTIEPSALQFLAKHSFDFNRLIQSGVQFQGKNCPLKTLFHEFLGSSATLCLHNGFVDLAFLYKQMYDVDLPETLDEFVNNLSDLFPDEYLPIADSKYLAEYQTRYKSSYLEYVFRRTMLWELFSIACRLGVCALLKYCGDSSLADSDFFGVSYEHIWILSMVPVFYHFSLLSFSSIKAWIHRKRQEKKQEVYFRSEFQRTVTDLAAKCVICLDQSMFPILGNCGHVCCGSCFFTNRQIRRDKSSSPSNCPFCRTMICELTTVRTPPETPEIRETKKAINDYNMRFRKEKSMEEIPRKVIHAFCSHMKNAVLKTYGRIDGTRFVFLVVFAKVHFVLFGKLPNAQGIQVVDAVALAVSTTWIIGRHHFGIIIERFNNRFQNCEL